MKKNFILSVLALAFLGSFAFAEEAVVIDFTKLAADTTTVENQNRHTLKDYAVSAGMTFTDEQKALMKSSLAIRNWEVHLNSSAQTTSSLALSQVKPATVRESSTVPFKGKDVMGVRIYFPSSSVGAEARIIPPFEIPAFDSSVVNENEEILDGKSEDAASLRSEEEDAEWKVGQTRFENGYGVVYNVGTIKSIKVTTLGMNQPHSLYVILKDQDDVERRYFMGYLSFDGWKELIWNNPSYIQEVRVREIRSLPIYPTATPHVKFIGFQICRDATCDGGDFIGYFKDVAIVYDKASLSTERDIADEDVWGIVLDRETARQNAEMQNFGLRQVEVFMEREKQATEAGFQSSLKEPEDAAAAQE